MIRKSFLFDKYSFTYEQYHYMHGLIKRSLHTKLMRCLGNVYYAILYVNYKKYRDNLTNLVVMR